MCRLCPGPACDQHYHAASDRVRAWLRERIERALAPVVRPDLPKRQEVARRPEGSPAVAVRPAREPKRKTTNAKRARRIPQAVIQAMIQRRSEGATLQVIAEEFGLKLTTAAKRLSLAQQRAVSEGRSELEDLKRCPDCKGKKRASRERCHRCETAFRGRKAA